MTVNKSRVNIEFPVLKSDEEKRLVMGVVLEPNVVDAHGDWESAEVIEKAAHLFLSQYNSETELGLQHKTFGIGVELVESYIAPQDLDLDGLLDDDATIKKGSWVMVVHIVDDDIWDDVKNGLITGFSIGGSATVLAADPA